MNLDLIANGLLMYLGLIVLLTFHEFGHAWVALKCGDDTARLQGRCSLNPIVHIDPIGTVILPLAMIFLAMAGSSLSHFLIGWAKPVPVNPHNLRRPHVDDILVTLAGPAMNLLLAVALMGLARLGLAFNSENLLQLSVQMASLSLFLAFFNLIPIPPLDGSQILRVLTNMSYETYWQFSRYGFIAIILVIQIPFVRELLGTATYGTLGLLALGFGFPPLH